MAKDILIYGGIHRFSAEFFIQQLDENSGKKVAVRMNTEGGDPVSAWGMIAKINEQKPKPLIKVDGEAHSMGAFILCYVDDVEALDVSTFVLHRAAFSSFFETDMNDEDAKKLSGINKNLRAALEAKIDVNKLKELKGVTIDEIFSMDSRINVHLTADEALQIGLVSRVVKLNPKEVSALTAKYGRIAASYNASAEKSTEKPVEKPLNNNKMDLNELKLKHPEVYATVYGAGVKAEQDRVGSWMVFVKADAEAVTAGIKGGEPLSNTDMAELNQKSYAASVALATEDASADDLNTEKPNADTTDDGEKITAAEANKTAFFAEVNESFKS